MRPIEIVMLAVLVAALGSSAFAVVLRRPTPERPRPLWTSLGVSLLLISAVAWNIADGHDGDLGARLLHYGSPVALGFGLAMMLLAVRERRFVARA